MIGPFDAVCLARADELLRDIPWTRLPAAAIHDIDRARCIMKRLIDEAEPLRESPDAPYAFWLGADA